VGEEENVTVGDGEGVNVSVNVGDGVYVSDGTAKGSTVRLGVREEVGDSVAGITDWMRMGVNVRIVGGREGVTTSGLGRTVTVSMLWQEGSKNNDIARATINCFILDPLITSISS
jgi:hypothetical protein